MNRRVPRWLIVVGGWTLFGLYMAFQNHYLSASAGRPESWDLSLFRELLYSSVWAFLTPLVLLFGRRFPLDGSRWFRYGFLHLVLGAAVSLMHRSFYGLGIAIRGMMMQGIPFNEDALLRSILPYFDYGVLLYWILLLVQQALRYYRRYQENVLKSARLETQLVQSQLEALKMQLHPHFLFNTLNAISVLVTKNPDEARRTVGRLSDLLRITMDQGTAQEVPLSRELDILDRYLAIERTRFASRLNVTFAVDKQTRRACVPSLVLQPLVENAIKHGVARRRARTRIEISAQRANGTLVLRVTNDAAENRAPGEMKFHEGIGLANTRARLSCLYGSASELRIANVRGPAVTVEVVIPYHEEPLHESAR